jgi:hypothetical protein
MNKNQIRLSGGSGHGSTNTCIRRFTTILENVGTAMTLNQSSTNGDSITINVPGAYSFAYSDAHTGSGTGSIWGLSVNSNQLTTTWYNITDSHRLIGVEGTGTANAPAGCAVTVWLNAGDVIRAHTNATPVSTSDAAVRLIATKI